MTPIIIRSILFILVYATLWFLYSRIKKRNDIADIAWGLGYILLGLCLWRRFDVSPRYLLVLALITLWGLRLAIHIATRNRKKGEDPRYVAMRKKWGKYRHVFSFLQVYLLQGILLLFVASPLLLLANPTFTPWNALDVLGITVWCIGFFFESIGDYQLRSFLRQKENKGKILTTGLWRYTRHPNYFGEVTMWWGIFFISLSSPYTIAALISPLTITILILFVSGIPMLEKRYNGNAEFEAYKKRTSAFFPLPPKKL